MSEPKPLLVVCGGDESAESYSVRSDNLATISTFDGAKTEPSKHFSGISYPYILTVTKARNSESKLLLNRHLTLQQKDSCGIEKNIECIDVAGGYIAAGTSEGNVLIWRASDGELVIEQNLHLGPITCLRIDTKLWVLFACSNTGRAGGWCIPDLYTSAAADQMWSIHSLRITDIAVSSGGRVYTVSHDQTLKCYDFAAGCEILAVAFPSQLTSVCLSHNESIAYVGDVEGNVFQVLLAQESEAVAQFEGHSAEITDLVVSDDDRALYSASLDGSIRRWDATTGQAVNRVDMKFVPFALRWLPPAPTAVAAPSAERGKKARQQAGAARKKGFPKLTRNVRGNKDEPVSCEPLDVPIITADEEAIIAVNDVTRRNALAQGSVSLSVQNS